VVCLERVFSINNEFSIYTHLYFDARRLPVLATAPAAKLSGVNMKELIAREHHVPLRAFLGEPAGVGVPAHVCEAIGVKPKTSGAVLEIVGRDPRGEAVYFQELFIPPTERRLYIAS
jgi:DNA-binding GntR family transcriptional regulator